MTFVVGNFLLKNRVCSAIFAALWGARWTGSPEGDEGGSQLARKSETDGPAQGASRRIILPLEVHPNWHHETFPWVYHYGFCQSEVSY